MCLSRTIPLHQITMYIQIKAMKTVSCLFSTCLKIAASIVLPDATVQRDVNGLIEGRSYAIILLPAQVN
jgi:hypothetical protein